MQTTISIAPHAVRPYIYPRKQARNRGSGGLELRAYSAEPTSNDKRKALERRAIT